VVHLAPARKLRRVADVLRNNEEDAYARFITLWRRDEIVDVTGEPAPVGEAYAEMLARSAGVAGADRPQLLDLVSYLPEDILTKVDRASMAVSLEVRAPLLDHRVVELAHALPRSMKRRGSRGKLALRELLYRRVPRELLDRPKMGFGVPLERWLRRPLRATMDELVRGSELERLGLNPVPARRLWDEFIAGQHRRADQVWQLFILLAWSRQQ
jgi:asparagine synthase (glutamine-hydrolysing)